jgi:acetoin utilization protein AcuB
MSKLARPILDYMTPTPHSIGSDQTLAMAQKLMKEHRIRHLPVLSGGKLCGLLSEREVKWIATLASVDAAKLTVEEAMIEEPFTVDPDTALDEVASTMAKERYGSALVTKDGHVIGIFTSVDACRALAELLETKPKHKG